MAPQNIRHSYLLSDRLLDNNNIKIELPISQAIPEPIANLSVQKPTVIDHSNQQDQTINKNLDILFKKEMEK